MADELWCWVFQSLSVIRMQCFKIFPNFCWQAKSRTVKYFLRSIWYPRESGWGGQARANKTMYRFVLHTWDWSDGVHKICSNETKLLQSSSWKQDSCWVAFDVTHSLMNQIISAGDWHVTYFSGKLFLKSNAWNCIVIFIR